MNTYSCARRLLKRAIHILDKREGGFKSFKDVEFLVLLPNINTLKDQTSSRILQDIQGYNFGESALDRLKYVENHVLGFHYSQKHRECFAAFQERAAENRDTLYVIVADECHWAIGKVGCCMLEF
jgi:hypothetical protein